MHRSETDRRKGVRLAESEVDRDLWKLVSRSLGVRVVLSRKNGHLNDHVSDSCRQKRVSICRPSPTGKQICTPDAVAESKLQSLVKRAHNNVFLFSIRLSPPLSLLLLHDLRRFYATVHVSSPCVPSPDDCSARCLQELGHHGNHEVEQL